MAFSDKLALGLLAYAMLFCTPLLIMGVWGLSGHPAPRWYRRLWQQLNSQDR
ncbi:MAG: hypothetical protein H7Y22_09050 [Gemmatimonadaceae bacterium]|nr:hypothetical protein [Gloeobacterales cyanobacterium ES-bin-141]